MQGVSEKLNQVGAYLKDNPSVLASLLAGTGSGVLGGALTAMEKPQEGEDPSVRRKRILRNALVSAGGGAAVGGLGTKGLSLLGTTVPEGPPPTAGENTKSFAVDTILRGLKSGLGYFGGRAIGHTAETFNPNLMDKVVKGLKSVGEAIPKTNFGTLSRYKQLNPLEKFPLTRNLGRIGALVPLLLETLGRPAPFAPDSGELDALK